MSEERSLNFLEEIIENDIAEGKNNGRVHTRFPPEPNGYLHIGHATSICLNFGLAKKYNGKCNLRFDDTNPVTEETEYVESIKNDIKWLGFEWDNEFYASYYFDKLYAFAMVLVEKGLAYVDDSTAEEIAASKGSTTTPGINSPSRSRSIAENIKLFDEMKAGKYKDGERTLRAKIDMTHPNLLLRDPLIYRIKHAHHHRTGDKWCIYPMYDFAHGQSDSIEEITHSICTLEFIHHRPLYNWFIEQLGIFPSHQYEFARRNLTYTVMSKRKLLQLVNEHHVVGWDDPRMPTIVGLRRRGYTPESLLLFAERIGVTKSDSWIDYSTLEGALRDTLDPIAPRAMAVLEPVKLVLTNWDDVMGAGKLDECSAPVHPHHLEQGKRHFKIGNEVWIERTDYEETPSKGFFRLFPPHVNASGAALAGSKVRLKYGHVIECTGATKDAAGNVTEVQALLVPDTKSGTPGSDAVKVKGVVTWVGVSDAVEAEVRLYDRLFTTEHPGAGDDDFLQELNADSLKIVTAYVEPSLANVPAGKGFQFERHGYFAADLIDHSAGKAVFNRVTGMKDSWAK